MNFAFYANRGSDQSVASASVWTQVVSLAAAFDQGSYFNSDQWVPPAGRVLMFGKVGSTGTIAAAAKGGAAIYKNGTIFKDTFRSANVNDATAFVSALDFANGSDAYSLWGWNPATAGRVFTGAQYYTNFCGYVLPATASCFHAHKNGINQSGIGDNVNTQLTFPNELFDQGGYFANDAWTPPAGYVLLATAARYTATTAAGNFATLGIAKNNTNIIFAQEKNFTNEGYNHCISIDKASGNDSYSVWLQTDVTSGTIVADGASDVTWFFGLSFELSFPIQYEVGLNLQLTGL